MGLCTVYCHSERGSINKAGKTWEEWVLRSPCDSDDENDDNDSGAEEVRLGSGLHGTCKRALWRSTAITVT
jgi:hypothetical protein